MSLLVARQNSARSTTGCSLADRGGTGGGFYGGAKLIEASLIRTLAKWSPQNAKAGRSQKGRKGMLEQEAQTRNKSIFSIVLPRIPRGSTWEMKMRDAKTYFAFVV